MNLPSGMLNTQPFWAAFLAGAAFASFVLVLITPVLQIPASQQSISPQGKHSFQAPKSNVFTELSSQERTTLIDFLHQSNVLNLTTEPSRFGSYNWISAVQVLRPNKSDVISYFDSTGPPPERYARVTVAQKDGENAFLADYMVGPLPPSDQTRIEPLLYNSGRNQVQTPLSDIMLLYYWALNVGHDVEDITEDLLGAKVNPLDLFSPDSLGLGARPIMIEGGKAMFWLEFYRIGPRSNGLSLLPQGLYVKLNMSSSNSDTWITSEWLYNGILYPDIHAFREAWSSPNFTKTSRNLDGAWTDTEDFDSRHYGRSKPPPISIQPYGPRYQIDRTQDYISWMGFSFYLATSPSTALSLFDIRFNDTRLIYHLGLQEALAHYAGSEPIQSGLEFLDTLFGMGKQMYSLVPGYDCPAYADYLDVRYHVGEKTLTNKNAICIFEYTSDAPLQRHTSDNTVTVSRNTYLVVRSISTVGNYDYTIDYIFYLDGSIEIKVRASGFIFAAFAGHPEPTSTPNTPSDSPTDELRSRDTSTSHPNSLYGYQIHPSASTSMHDHVLLFRADLDISPTGLKDTFQRVSITPYTHTYPWDAPYTERNTMHLVHHPSLSHEGSFNWPANSADLYLIQSPEKNAWSEHKSYRIQPGTGMGTPSHLTIINSTSLGRSALWSSADLWVLKHHDNEPAAAHEFNYLCPLDPIVDFAKMADNETLRGRDEDEGEEDVGGEDLVLYFNLGGHHVPHSSDIPNTLMHTSASSVLLSPFNYFDEDVSKYSRQGVRVDRTTREDVGWKEGVRVVGGGRYEDYQGENGKGKGGGKQGKGEGKVRKLEIDVRRDLEPDVDGYFRDQDDEGEAVGGGKRIQGGLLGLWPIGGRG